MRRIIETAPAAEHEARRDRGRAADARFYEVHGGAGPRAVLKAMRALGGP